VLNPTLTNKELQATNQAVMEATAEQKMVFAEETKAARANTTITPQPTHTPMVEATPTALTVAEVSSTEDAIEQTAVETSDNSGEKGGGMMPSCLTGMVMLFGLTAVFVRKGQHH
jgi:biotin carboxyl carrier protein